jgi:hypothetical protein
MTAWTRSRRSSLASIRPTWTLTVPSDRCRSSAISRLDRPAASWTKTVCSRSVSLLSRTSRSCCRPGPGIRGTNLSMSRRVVVGARTASPPATVRIAVSSSAGGASLRRNPLAPALSPAKTYSSRSKVVRIRTLAAGLAAVMRAVAAIPSMPGIRTSISTTSGCRADVIFTPAAPSPASPATSMSGSASRISRNPILSRD